MSDLAKAEPSKPINDDGPAFPTPTPFSSEGMTLRDYFASKALQGLLADSTNISSPEKNAYLAYKFADAMIAARKGVRS